MLRTGKFNDANNFFPKYKIPISAKIIITRITKTLPKILLLAKIAAIKKHN